MKKYKNVQTKLNKGVLTVFINRPDALNALNSALLDELIDLFTHIQADEAIEAVIVTGNGRAFVAGADISEMVNLDTQEIRRYAIKGQSVMNLIEGTDKPVIAAVNGFALGGGNELAMACHIRFASDKAKFGQPEVNLGILPFFGGTQRLSRLVGKGMAKYLIVSAEMINAEEALRIGLVERVVPADELLKEAEKFVRNVLSKSPIGVRMALLAINNGLDMDLNSGLAYEVEAAVNTFASKDRKAGMKAFLEKKNPRFSNK